MPASKSCPTCHQAWAANFKFCPRDGTTLVEATPTGRAGAQASKTILTPIANAPPLRPPPENLRTPIQALDQAIARTRSSTNTKPRKAEPRLFDLEPVRLAPAAAPAAAPVVAPAEAAPAAVVRESPRITRRRRGGFSETAWFMRPDQPVDPATGRVRFDPQAYAHDESIPEEKRRRFSLRRKDEE